MWFNSIHRKPATRAVAIITASTVGVAYMCSVVQRKQARIKNERGNTATLTQAADPLPCSVSVIIPILNEAASLPTLMTHIYALQPSPQQVILVDGGSADGSYDRAHTLIKQIPQCPQAATASIDWQVITAQAGRARQMNAGAAMAAEDVLLFLHADTQLPSDALAKVNTAIAQADWGRFDVRLDSTHPALWVVGQMINLRSRVTGIATGDQAIFVKTALFNQLGGYPNIALMEDVALCKALKKRSPPACLSDKAITSARRWQQHGIATTIILMWRLRLDYWRGMDPVQLKARYYK